MSELSKLPGELIIEEAKRRTKEIRGRAKKSRDKMRKCLGCKKKFNARDMRTHPCKVGWTKRQPYRLERRGDRYVYIVKDTV
jgi:hypothetical protein